MQGRIRITMGTPSVTGCFLLALVIQTSAGPARQTTVLAGQDPAARVAVRNELGINPVTLTTASLPRLGGRWEASLDCGGHAVGTAILSAREAPLYGIVVDAGEILIDVFSGAHLLTLARPHGGGAVTFVTSIPDDPALLGFEAHVQGLCTGGPRALLSNALGLVFGR